MVDDINNNHHHPHVYEVECSASRITGISSHGSTIRYKVRTCYMAYHFIAMINMHKTREREKNMDQIIICPILCIYIYMRIHRLFNRLPWAVHSLPFLYDHIINMTVPTVTNSNGEYYYYSYDHVICMYIYISQI